MTSSKLLGEPEQNFIGGIQGLGNRKIAKVVMLRNLRWPPCPCMVNIQMISPEPPNADILQEEHGAPPFMK